MLLLAAAVAVFATYAKTSATRGQERPTVDRQSFARRRTVRSSTVRPACIRGLKRTYATCNRCIALNANLKLFEKKSCVAFFIIFDLAHQYRTEYRYYSATSNVLKSTRFLQAGFHKFDTIWCG